MDNHGSYKSLINIWLFLMFLTVITVGAAQFDFGILNADFEMLMLDLGFWNLDFGLWIWEFETWKLALGM